jgi:hypothetical protein
MSAYFGFDMKGVFKISEGYFIPPHEDTSKSPAVKLRGKKSCWESVNQHGDRPEAEYEVYG